MRVDSMLRALVRDPAPQHAAQAKVEKALTEWLAEPARRELFDQLDAYGGGTPLQECTLLARVFAHCDSASALAGSLVRCFLPVLAAEALARMPFRQSSQGASANLLLGKSGRAYLSLIIIGAGVSDHDAVGFGDGERHDMVLAGAGVARIVRLRKHGKRRGLLQHSDVAIARGFARSFDLAHEALLARETYCALVSFRLTRLAKAARPAREYRLSDGVLLGQAAGDPRASRQEMMLAMLGRMKRADAAPVFAEIARGDEPGLGDHLRWQALRECLALDTATGFRALCGLACDPADPLAQPAGALRAQLLEDHPQLAALQEQPCPA